MSGYSETLKQILEEKVLPYHSSTFEGKKVMRELIVEAVGLWFQQKRQIKIKHSYEPNYQSQKRYHRNAFIKELVEDIKK